MDRFHPEYVAANRYLYDRINFEKTIDRPYDQLNYRLARMEGILALLGNPQNAAPVIHIAGTKGKGSTASYIAEILRRSGRKVGLYTSPHIEFIEERFCIDGRAIEPAELVRGVRLLESKLSSVVIERLGVPTFFELTTAIAWSIFQERQTDVNVIEVGLGGRLDSTNVCDSVLSVITSISFDHQAQLGTTLQEIAGEKAGIIKPASHVIVGVSNPIAREVVRTIAAERNCDWWTIDEDFATRLQTHGHFQTHSSTLPTPRPIESTPSFKSPEGEQSSQHTTFDYLPKSERVGIEPMLNVSLRMLGEHQTQNAGLAIAACQKLNTLGWGIPEKAIREGLANTQVASRIELASCAPYLVLDAAHNVASTEALLATLRNSFEACKRTIVFASSKDKDYEAMLKLHLAYADRLILTQFHTNPRTVPLEKLEETTSRLQTEYPGVEVLSATDVSTALDYVFRHVQPQDLVCFTGSFFLVGEAREALTSRQSASLSL